MPGLRNRNCRLSEGLLFLQSPAGGSETEIASTVESVLGEQFVLRCSMSLPIDETSIEAARGIARLARLFEILPGGGGVYSDAFPKQIALAYETATARRTRGAGFAEKLQRIDFVPRHALTPQPTNRARLRQP